MEFEIVMEQGTFPWHLLLVLIEHGYKGVSAICAAGRSGLGVLVFTTIPLT